MSHPLPPGTFSWNPAASTLNFHHSTHGVVHEQANAHADSPLLHLKVIGRDVLLVRDFKTALRVFEDGQRFSSRLAYSDLMANYYPEPNIWYEDTTEPNQAPHRTAWSNYMADRLSGSAWAALQGRLRLLVRRHCSQWISAGRLDLYKCCKDLAHDIFMYLFLGLDASQDAAQYKMAGQLTHTMMCGQFSLPVDINLGIWKSPHAKGMAAKRQFQSQVLGPQLQGGQCPFFHAQPPSSVHNLAVTDQNSHSLMFASCMVEKSLASTLTTLILQLSRDSGGATMLDMLSESDEQARKKHLAAIYLENGRLASASLGAMRRNRGGEILLPVDDKGNRVRVPNKWDVWIYFPDVMRDPLVYGPTACLFDPTRYLQDEGNRPPDPLTFGGGAKSCLGANLVQKICSTVLEELFWPVNDRAARAVQARLDGGEANLDESVKDFLGWRTEGALQSWPGVKQLPIQRPRYPVWFTFSERR